MVQRFAEMVLDGSHIPWKEKRRMLGGVTLLLEGAASEAAKETQSWMSAVPLLLDAMQNHENVVKLRQCVEVRSQGQPQGKKVRGAGNKSSPSNLC